MALALALTSLWLLPAASATYVDGVASLDGAAAEAYRQRGHVLTRGVLNRTELEALSTTLSSLLLAHGRRAFGGDGGQKEVRFTFAVHELDASLAAFVANRGGELWSAAAKLAGTEELCLLMDRGFSKDPGDPETHWHRDDEAIGLPAQHPDIRTVHAWVPLSAMGKDMGTLQYLVGTHRRSFSRFENFLASVWGWEFAWFVTSPSFQDDDLDLGDIAWHDGWVLHSAGTNTGSAVRNGLAASFAYCAASSGCGGAAARTSDKDVTCRVAARLFDEGWRRRHRSGENDYAKTLLQEPLIYRAGRFMWRSVLGALGGLTVHWLAVSGCRCCGKRKEA